MRFNEFKNITPIFENFDLSKVKSIINNLDHSSYHEVFLLNIKNNIQQLENVKQAGLKLRPFGIHQALKTPVYVWDNQGRYTVSVDYNGINLPFYFSTGLGGKVNVPEDKWYPFFGATPKWIIKGSEKMILDYYTSPLLKSIAEILNKTFPQPKRDPINVEYGQKSSKNPEIPESQCLQVINQGLTPVDRGAGAAAFISNINSLLHKIGARGYNLPGSDNQPQKTNQPKQTNQVVTGPLTLSNGVNTLSLRISNTFGRSIAKQFGDESRFYSEDQFRLEKNTDDTWKLIPDLNATNSTMINGIRVTTPTVLSKGMRISVGNPEKKIEKLPLTVS